jgi:plasmid stabilization system protein ParE
MMYAVRVLPSAETDVAGARDWYEDQAELGGAFVDEFEALLVRLAHLPERFPLVRPRVHRALFGRFPYTLYFRIQDERVDVLAVLHSRSGPEKVDEATR